MGKDNQFDLLLRRSRRLAVGACQVDLALNEVHGPGGSARLAPKAAAVLEVLLYTAGQPVSKERLLVEVWRGEYPTDDVVTHAIGELRRAFGDDARQPRYIRTLARVGYALIADVGALDDLTGPPAARPTGPMVSTVTAEAAAPTGPPIVLPPPPLAEPGPALRAATAVTVPPARRGWLAGCAVLALLLAVLAWRWLAGGGEPAVDATGEAPPAGSPRVEPATWLPGSEQFPSLSPDGSLLAFSADPEGQGTPRIHLQVLGEGNPRALSSTPVEREVYPVFSPDGRQLALQRVVGGGCALVVASVLGGAEREVGSCTSDMVRHMTWTPDGKALVIQTLEEGSPSRAVLYRLDLASGLAAPLDYPTSATESDVQARYSPDGEWLAFRRGPIPHSDLYLMRADGSALRRLTRLRSEMPGFDWMPDGQSLVFASGHQGTIALYRVELATGQIVALGIENAAWPDMASLRDELVFVPDGVRLEVVEVTLDGDPDSTPRRIAATSRNNSHARYSNDGQRIALASDRSGEWAVYVVGAGEIRRLASHTSGMLLDPRWSPDDRQLLYVVRGNGSRLFTVEVASGQVRDLTPPGHTVMSAAYSPDGRGIAFTSDASGQWEVWWMDLARSGALRQLTQGGGRRAEFRDAGRLVHVAGTEVGRLQQLDLASGAVTDLGVQVDYWNQHAWYPTPDALFVLRGGHGVFRRDWDGRQWELVEPLPKLPIGDLRMALDAQQGRVLLTASAPGHGDVSRVRGLTSITGAQKP